MDCYLAILQYTNLKVCPHKHTAVQQRHTFVALLLRTVEISSSITPALKANSEFGGIFEFIQKPELFPLRLMLPATA